MKRNFGIKSKSNIKNRSRRSGIRTATLLITAIFLISSSVLLFNGCATLPTKVSADDLKGAYLIAVADAKTAEPNEISRDLVPIVETNEDLVWRDENKKELLVVTWTSWDGYDKNVGKTMVMSRKVWVTTVPELRNFSKDNRLSKGTPTAMSLRLEQLMGLPPNNGKDRFVEIWVSPEDLFRPSPDPEITDREAELDFPKPKKIIAISNEYILWFSVLKSKSYGKDGYPWTRLGYTYDWGNKKSEVGLSEFVILEGAKVKIHSVTKTIDYCK